MLFRSDEAVDEMLPVIVLYFFSIRLERGRELHVLFRAFKKAQSDNSYRFCDFIEYEVDRAPIARAFMPQGCRRYSQEALRPATQEFFKRMRWVPQENLLAAGLEEIYFGRGEAYEEVRRYHCSKCPLRGCKHHNTSASEHAHVP